MKNALKKIILRFADLLTVPVTYISLPVLRFVRRFGVKNFPLNKAAFMRLGVFPIRNHYYDPQFVYSAQFDADRKRNLHIDLRETAQISFLNSLNYSGELKMLKTDEDLSKRSFYVNNPAFGPGDADMYYLLIRNCKPKRIIEIGSGFSTLLAVEAIRQNKREGFETEITCIEPYEMSWLKEIPEVRLIRQRVEKISLEIFSSLEDNDILFIDSSHIIRPENDVLFEFLQLLPVLRKGVLVHIHDIFTPRHYRNDWLTEEFRFWNEQYLLEAFLYYNNTFQVVAALNYLKHDYYEDASKILTLLTPVAEPASFWLRKVE